jgi:hypothetical protein
MIPQIVSKKAYDEMLEKKNKTIADLLKALERLVREAEGFLDNGNTKTEFPWAHTAIKEAREKI